MSSDPKTPLAFLTGLQESYGTLELSTQVVTVQPNGELHGVSWDYGRSLGSEYDGFHLDAYVGPPNTGLTLTDSERERGIWGTGIHYAPFRVKNAEQASAIASVFRKLDKGRDRLNQEMGYIVDEDYAGNVLRVAQILKITRFYVRNRLDTRAHSGDHNRSVNGAGLQSYCLQVEADVKANKKHQYIR